MKVYKASGFTKQLHEIKAAIALSKHFPTQQVFESTRATFASKSTFTIEQQAEFLPKFVSMKSGLNKRRSQERPKLAKIIAEVSVTGKYALPDKKERFLLYDKQKELEDTSLDERIMIFCSPKGLESLSVSDSWHSDGTFHTASKYRPTRRTCQSTLGFERFFACP